MWQEAANGADRLFGAFPGASSISGEVDLLFWSIAAVSAAVTLAILSLIVFYSWRYRASSNIERPSPHIQTKRELAIEFAWTVPVVAIFLCFFFWGAALYAEQYGDAKGAATVNVVGKQWMWKIEHHGGVREINTLHLPVGEKVRIRLTSEDVIHSFSLPAFRLKRDAVPQRYTTFSFTPTRTGTFHLLCTEFCGADHSLMRGKIVVMERQDFERWLGRQDVPDTPAEHGKELFTAYGCSGCHADRANVHAPRLEGLFGRPVQLSGGESVVADDDYLRDSILLPQKQVVAGYAPIMPSYEGQIGEDEILEIIAYIASLSEREERP